MEDVKTLSQLLREFLEHGRALNQSPLTLKNHRFYVNHFLRRLEAAEGVCTADRLARRHLETWFKHLLDHRTIRGLPLKPESFNKAIQSVKSFLRYLAERDYILKSLPAALEYVKTPSLLPKGVLMHAQVRTLLGKIRTGTAEGYRDRAMLELLYSSGIRSAELLSLNVGDVDLKHATAIVMGKGRKQRVVPIGRTALRHLETYIAAVRPYQVRAPANQALFLKRNGERLGYDGLLVLIRRHVGAAGLDGPVSAHTFRRSCATELIKGGANLYHIKELLGHESLDTLRHYAKLTITDLKKTHEKCHPRERDELS